MTGGLTTQEAFRRFHEGNPHVYHVFQRLTNEALGRGATRLSAWWVINVARWEVMFRTEDDNSSFKIGNDYIAHYARMFMHDHPLHRGLFVTKALKNVGPRPIRQRSR